MEDWSRIVTEHGQTVWQTAFRLLGSESDAADCVQEAFAAAVKVSRRENVRNWQALLRRLAATQALYLLRQRLRERKHLESTELSEIRDPAPSPQDQAQAGELNRRLRQALTKLPEQQAIAFSLRFLEGMSNEEVADALAVSSNAVGVLIHRARAKLREQMTSAYGLGKNEVQHD